MVRCNPRDREAADRAQMGTARLRTEARRALERLGRGTADTR